MVSNALPLRAVFDCNVLLQAMANPAGPAGACLEAVFDRRLELFVSPAILGELTEVAARPSVVRKLALSVDKSRQFLEELSAVASIVDLVEPTFQHPTDPKDNPIIDLAIAVSAHLITSRDKHLLSLRDPTSPEGAAFLARFGSIAVLTPVELLDLLRAG